MRKKNRILLSALMAVCILICSFPTARAANDTQIIRDILYYYGQHQEKAETDITRLVESLSPENREMWSKILTCWHKAYEEQDNILQLPDTLPKDEKLCIIVMGYSLHADGTMKDELIGRLQTALSVLETYPGAYILCTGGGTASYNPSITEAGSMARWLKEQGVDEEKIIVENRAYSTEENAINSFRILSEQYPDVDTVILVSSDYHLRRCKLLFYAETVLKDMDDRYTIAGWAGYKAGHTGAEDPPNDAESLGPMAGIYIDKDYVPKLCKLTQIIVEGNDSCMEGDSPPFAVSACYDNGFFRDVTRDAAITGFDSQTPGTQEVTVSYTENGICLQETRVLTVHPLPTETTQPPVPPTTMPLPTTEPQPTKIPEELTAPSFLPYIGGTSAIIVIAVLLLILRKRR